MMASAQRQPCLEAFLNPCSLQLNFQSNRIAFFSHPAHTMNISLYLIMVLEPHPAWYQKLTVLLSQLAAGQGQYKQSISSYFICLQNKFTSYYLKMGCVNSCLLPHDLNNIQKTTGLQYSRKILEVVLDTLQTIDKNYPQCKIKQNYKLRCGIDSSFKDVRELKVQLELTVMLFALSKEKLAPQKFTYDDVLSKEIATGIIEQNIKYFERQDKQIVHICQVLLDILKGLERPQFKEWKTNLDPENPQKTVNKKLLKDGMKVTQMKDKIEASVNKKFETISVGAQ